MSDAESASTPAAAPASPETSVTPRAATGTTAGGGVTFDFVYNSTDYTCAVYAGDKNGQYGFTITRAPASTTNPPPAPTTVASLIYAPASGATPEGWQIQVSLPSALQVDTNLSVSQLTVDISKGTVQPLS